MNTFNKTLSRVTLVLGVTFMSAFQLYADDWKEIMYADPTIFVENGKYYLTGTRNQEPQGFAILESTDLEHWTVPDGTSLQLILRALGNQKASFHCARLHYLCIENQ